MTENVINLRGEQKKQSHTSEDEDKDEASVAEINQEASDELFWTAPEFPHESKSAYWYIAIISVTIFLVVLGVVSQSIFFVAFVVLAAFLIIYYSRRRPHDISFRVAKEGVAAGKTFYPYADLKSFWIFDKRGESELSVETKYLLHPVLRIPLLGVSAEEIREYLRAYLPEEEHYETLSDRLMHILKI